MRTKPYLKIDFPEGRLCCHCKKIKPFSKYTKDKKCGWKGYRRECKVCTGKRANLYYQKNKEKICKRHRENHRQHRLDPEWKLKEKNQRSIYLYGKTLDNYNQTFSQQNGCCAICGRHQSELKKILGWDHNHKTDKIRELLCDKCNSFIGLADEDIEILKRAINYLERHNE